MRRRRPVGRAFLVSAIAHAALLVPLVVLARPPEPMEFETVRINLVSPPPADAAQTDAEPAPTPPAPEPDPVQEQPEPEAEEPEREEPPPERPPENVERPRTERPETPPAQPAPRQTDRAPEAPTGGDDINIATEGVDFPFPDYVANILVQLRRYIRWTDSTRPRADIYFEILPDGSVRNFQMVQSSGNFRFDIVVEGAVESASNRGDFGPLPDAYVGPFLPVNLEVEPPQ